MLDGDLVAAVYAEPKPSTRALIQRNASRGQVVERSYGAFERRIPLPYHIDPDAVDAKFTRGVLTVILPKPPEEKKATKRISVKAG